MVAEKFVKEDRAYLEWVEKCSNGYVINAKINPRPGYLVLHRASCSSISEYKGRRKPGGFTERKYIKVCANSIEELRAWLKENFGTGADFSRHRCRCDAFSDEQS